MATYDLNVILDPNLTEKQIQTEKDTIETQLGRVEGTLLELDEWGNRRLAYPILKQSEGYYLIYKLELSGDTPKTLESALRIRDNVMRALVVRHRPEWRTRKAKSPKPQAEVSSPKPQVEASPPSPQAEA